jgi:hypothetical protein
MDTLGTEVSASGLPHGFVGIRRNNYMTKLNSSQNCKDEIETEEKWDEKAQSLLFKAEMHNLQTPAPLKSPLCTCNNNLM